MLRPISRCSCIRRSIHPSINQSINQSVSSSVHSQTRFITSLNKPRTKSISPSFTISRAFTTDEGKPPSKGDDIDPRDKLPPPGLIKRILFRMLQAYIRKNLADPEFRPMFERVWRTLGERYPDIPKDPPIDWSTGELLNHKMFRTREEDDAIKNEMVKEAVDLFTGRIHDAKESKQVTAEMLTLPIYQAINQSIKPRSFGIRLPYEMPALLKQYEGVHHLSYVESWSLAGQTEAEFIEGLKFAFTAANQSINQSVIDMSMDDISSIDELPESLSSMFYGGYARHQLQHLLQFRSISPSVNTPATDVDSKTPSESSTESINQPDSTKLSSESSNDSVDRSDPFDITKLYTEKSEPAKATTSSAETADSANQSISHDIKVPQLEMQIDNVKILSSTINSFRPLKFTSDDSSDYEESSDSSAEHFDLLKFYRTIADPPVSFSFGTLTPPAVVLQVTALFDTTEKITFADCLLDQPVDQSTNPLSRFAITDKSKTDEYDRDWLRVHSGESYKRQHIAVFAAELSLEQYARVGMTVIEHPHLITCYLPLGELLGDLIVSPVSNTGIMAVQRTRALGSVYGVPTTPVKQTHEKNRANAPYTVKASFAPCDMQWRIRSINQSVSGVVRETNTGAYVEVEEQPTPMWYANETAQQIRQNLKLQI